MYNTGKRTSIKRVLEKVYRDYGLNTEVVWADVIEWVAEAINLLGLVPSYENKIKKIVIENYRGELPCDIMFIKAIRTFDTLMPLIRSFDQFHLANTYRCEDEEVALEVCDSDVLTYTCNDNFIFTSFKEGELELSYTAIPTDEEGLPMIPDEDTYIRAMAAYVGERLISRLFWQGKATIGLKKEAETERDWAFGSAKMTMVIPDPDKMESLKNQFLRLIPNIHQHSRGFKYMAHPSKQINHSN